MEENTTPPLERRCPACGAAMPQEARFCGACGMESLPTDALAEQPASADSAPTDSAMSDSIAAAASAPTSATPTPAVAPPPPAAPSAPSAPAAPSPAVAKSNDAHANGAASGAEGRMCPWCDTLNPPDATRCVACDAVFPTPAGDEAVERAARARIQSMESEINQRRAGWWPFRAR